ncbi:MAG: tRNA (N6-isopentenyl adenosine(37)-C2)-methylthiotransferase MiaB [Lachnospiraceae bacterium]|nr:tRNA (N6-isopentenyl adenosine(37)-C2)-methylthiotransferase MiaB [Lachnospiraceae bacterium]
MEQKKELEKILEDIDLRKNPPVSEPLRQYYFMKKLRAMVSAQAENFGRPMTYCMVSFGCQMNGRDSERLAGIVQGIGYERTENEAEADFVLYNTCTVREHANQRVYGRLGQLKAIKKANPHKLIAISGCMTQDPLVLERLKTSYSFLDILLGTHNNFKIAELLDTKLETGGMIIDIWKDSDFIVEDLPIERKYSYKAGVNVMFGCDNHCSYCIVPYVRGRERSRNPEVILREIKDLANEGVIEVMLLGQNVNSYGKTLAEHMSFAQLLEEIEKIEKIKRIRFMTSHPMDLSQDLIEVISKSKKICNHLHLPVQSGSSRILRLMNRFYTREDYLLLVEKIRKARPDISLTTDIIVAFPEETEDDFQKTLDLIEEVGFDSAFTFIYSTRNGTPAAIMEQIPTDVAKARFNRLLEVVHRVAEEKSGALTGTVQEVLVEGINEQDTSFVTGRLSNNVLVHFPGDDGLIGKLMDVKLVESKGFYYIGESAR